MKILCIMTHSGNLMGYAYGGAYGGPYGTLFQPIGGRRTEKKDLKKTLPFWAGKKSCSSQIADFH
jgi:hypothetical protein